MTQYLPEVEAIAREAGALLMGYFASHVTIEYKGDVDLVTEADRASEKMIVERLRTRWPEHGIVGEEGARSGAEADYRWYVDPLDGTTNFAHGYPVFCISIALVRNTTAEGAGKEEQIEVGILYDPTRDEMFSAERGHGATLNGKRRFRYPRHGVWRNRSSALASPATNGIRIPISTSITRSHCVRMGYGAPDRRHSTWPISPADVMTGSGSSI